MKLTLSNHKSFWATILLILLLSSGIALQKCSAQSQEKTKVPFNHKQHWAFDNLNDSTLVATLHKDTLFVHKPELITIKEQSHELRYLQWKGKTYRYQYAFYDKAYFYARIKGEKIY